MYQSSSGYLSLLLLLLVTAITLAAAGTASWRRPHSPSSLASRRAAATGKDGETTGIGEAGDILDLSKMLADGATPHEMQNASRVKQLPGLPDGVDAGYSAFFSVDESSGTGKMFFWYFPAQNGNASAPTLMWLQGGPGGSSLFGLFAEMGPLVVNDDLTTLAENEYSWNQEYAMLFIDNPFGAGFSFADDDDSYGR